MQHNRSQDDSKNSQQFSTFFVAGRIYGVDVTTVQEVVKTMTMTEIPLSDNYIKGLINLRGQVVTAICLQDLFEIKSDSKKTKMNVICKSDGSLISLLVDEIGDVIEVAADNFEQTPSTIPVSIRKFMSGVYKEQGYLLSVLDINKISHCLTNGQEIAA